MLEELDQTLFHAFDYMACISTSACGHMATKLPETFGQFPLKNIELYVDFFFLSLGQKQEFPSILSS